jgi:Skp family chaperone for outer membrane proteins
MAMKKQTSIKVNLLMALLVIAGMLTAQRAVYSRQIAPETDGYKEFGVRIEEYEKIRKDAEKSLSDLKKTSKQEKIEAEQKALENKIRELRSNAQRGDIFTPNATAAIARAIKALSRNGSLGEEIPRCPGQAARWLVPLQGSFQKIKVGGAVNIGAGLKN